MTPDDPRPGLGALIEALILSIASLVLVLWIVAVTWGNHALFTTAASDATSLGAPKVGADIASRIRAAP